MPQHTENWVGTFWGKISDQNVNPISEQSSVRYWQYPSGQMLQLQLRSYLQPGTHASKFQMDITRTFSATNISLENLGHPDMKDFFAKYLAQYPLVHPIKKREYEEEE